MSNLEFEGDGGRSLVVNYDDDGSALFEIFGYDEDRDPPHIVLDEENLTSLRDSIDAYLLLRENERTGYRCGRCLACLNSINQICITRKP